MRSQKVVPNDAVGKVRYKTLIHQGNLPNYDQLTRADPSSRYHFSSVPGESEWKHGASRSSTLWSGGRDRLAARPPGGRAAKGLRFHVGPAGGGGIWTSWSDPKAFAAQG